MGIMKRWMNGSLGNGGSSAIDANSVLQANGDGVNPLSSINWTVSSPTVLRNPVTATVAEADKAEHEAGLFEVAVTNGKRVMRAETRKQTAHSDLVVTHRNYLGKTAKANLRAATANVGLANALQTMRKDYAQLGMGLERTIDKTNQTIDVIAAKYGQVRK